jgi:hypothetical protein
LTSGLAHAAVLGYQRAQQLFVASVIETFEHRDISGVLPLLTEVGVHAGER